MIKPDKPLPIRVSTLRGDLKIPFDAFVRVAGKLILFCRRGDSFEGKRLERLKAKKLKQMFIRPEDEPLYLQYLQSSIDIAYDEKSGKDLDLRAEVIQGFQQAAGEEYMDDTLNELNYNHAKKSIERFTRFICKDPAGASALIRLANTEMDPTHHGVTVAALSITMSAESVDREKLETMALGCLFHDIDHYTNGINLNRANRTFSAEEMAAYKRHPLQGAHYFQGAPFVDQLVISIITQHEEHIDGTGFPKGLREKDMDPLVLTAATANAYDRLVCFHQMNTKDALKALLIEKMGIYPLGYLMNLQGVLKRLQIV